MTPTEFERVRELFHMVRKLQPEAQAERLNQACPDNAELRAEVEALLAYQGKSHGLLDVPVRFGATTPSDTAQGPLPKRIGRYRILDLLGEGGMGTVYLAEQEHPRRKVALKLVRAGNTSRAMLQRLEREASILGQLEHPGIARIYEAGVADMQTGDGLNVRTPFFAMEYVRGQRLNEHVERANLSTQQRLDLVASICDAVHHAHQQGVVHRDLKPSNILVDEQNRPKILDFGVARVTDADVQTVTLQTATGQLIGTIGYMSPEQVAGVSTNVDTRSDVYSLGVILYELLTGHVPHDVSHMTIPQAVRTIEQEDATPLSSVDKMYRGDIDTIVSKTLEKEKDRRYQSASDLAADIRHFLADQPISAHPPTTMYQLCKFARRNKTLVGGAAATFLALLIGVIGISLQAVRIARERDHAEHAEQIAEQRRIEADRSAAIAEAVNAFLNDDLLASVAPEFKGKDVLMRDVLDSASEAIEEKFADSPVVEASIRTTLGNTYKKLGAYGVAEKHLEKALALGRTELGEEHTRTVAAMSNLANLYRLQGRYDEAEPLLLKTLDLRNREFGKEHQYTLHSMNNLANLYIDQGRLDMAETLYAKTLEIRLRLLGEDDPATLISMNNLAALHDDRGVFDKAEPLYLRTLELRQRVLGEEHPHTVLSINNLAVMYHNQGRLDEAEPLYEEALRLRRRELGEEHPSTLSSMDNLAILYHRKGRLDEAEELHIKALEVQRRVLGEEHPSTLKTMNNLATLYESQGYFDKAELLHVKVLEVRLRILGEEHQRTLISMRNLGLLYRKQLRFNEAESLFVRTLELRRRVLGEDHQLTRRVGGDLLELYKMTGELDKARPLVADVLEVYQQQANSPNAGARALNRYAWELLTCPVVDLRDPEAAVDFATRAVAASNELNSGILDTLSLAQHMTGDSNRAVETQIKAVALLPPGPSPDRTDFESSLAKYLLAAHRYAEAEPVLHTLHRQLSEDGNASASQLGASRELLITLYNSWDAVEPGKGYADEAAEWYAKLPESLEGVEPAE